MSPFPHVTDGKQRHRRTCPRSHSLALRAQGLVGKTLITAFARISPDAFGLKRLQRGWAGTSSGAGATGHGCRI